MKLVNGLALTAICWTSVLYAQSHDQMDRQVDLEQYATIRLTTDMAVLSPNERRMIPHLIEASKIMDRLYWNQVIDEDPHDLLAAAEGPVERAMVRVNYGPWDRLNGDRPFLESYGPKPPGANFYPADLTKEEAERAMAASPDFAEDFRSLYTLVRRRDDGTLTTVWYHEAYTDDLAEAASHIRMAAELAEDPGLKEYLELRAEALVTDEFQPSDLAWLDMKSNRIEFVVGPIETYEDQLFGYKAAYEAYVLVKDIAWSNRLSRYAQFLPQLQRGLPVPDEYKTEMPGTDAELNAYDAVYYAGQANAGSKTIAINLPNDEEVQLAKGTRRLQLKNAMRAKFDSILVPIAEVLIVEDQRRHITFDAFFGNTMFHEVAHGLGIKNTINDRGTVREALKEHASALEEGKADILGLYMITELFEDGEITEGSQRDNYVTFLASIFRSVRFGASSAHGRANMIRFNYFREQGAFARDESTGTYRVDFDKMETAIESLSRLLLMLQGDGDYRGAGSLVAEKGIVGPELQADLDRLAGAGIPVDIVFEQGWDVLK